MPVISKRPASALRSIRGAHTVLNSNRSVRRLRLADTSQRVYTLANGQSPREANPRAKAQKESGRKTRAAEPNRRGAVMSKPGACRIAPSPRMESPAAIAGDSGSSLQRPARDRYANLGVRCEGQQGFENIQTSFHHPAARCRPLPTSRRISIRSSTVGQPCQPCVNFGSMPSSRSAPPSQIVRHGPAPSSPTS